MSKANIKDAVIAVTYRCNSRCTMCNIWKNKDNSGELRPADFSFLPQSLRDINLSGGEPFLRSDLIDIVKVIKKRIPSVNIIISSNGFATDLITKQMKAIKEVDRDIGVVFSLDGVGAKHDEIRGIEGGYGKVLSSINSLRDLGVKKIKLAFTIGDYNYNELPFVYDLASQFKMELSLAVVHSSESFFNKENKLHDKQNISNSLDWLIQKELSSWSPKKWARAYFTYGAKNFIETGERILPDYSGQKNIFIDPRGNIYPCDVSGKKIGQISADKFFVDSIDTSECAKSWMVCTAREAIKKHFFRVGFWILKNKFFKNENTSDK